MLEPDEVLHLISFYVRRAQYNLDRGDLSALNYNLKNLRSTIDKALRGESL